jgi:hypothetical protein
MRRNINSRLNYKNNVSKNIAFLAITPLPCCIIIISYKTNERTFMSYMNQSQNTQQHFVKHMVCIYKIEI